ncbi:ABC transporter transmembrane domain-containing protein [Nocardia tengchongensis]|uniref:ABC transporter transmembrane domain-containing protein n=1 Tax=Nocardia tengchongensis TaxID=2055889 RepID=UPI00365CBE32
MAGPLTAAGLIVAVAAVCSVVPFLLIVSACRELLRDTPDADRVWRLLLIAVLVLVARAILQTVALTWSHAVDARYQLTLRRLLADKLTRVPLGWFGARASADVKKYLQDDVEALHYLVAHARLDFIGSVTAPLVTLVYLATVDWRLTLVLLLPLIVYALCMRAMLDEPGRERLLAYNAAEQRTRAATVEFVDGIQVSPGLRASGQGAHRVPHRRRGADRPAATAEAARHDGAVDLGYRGLPGVRHAADRGGRAGGRRPGLAGAAGSAVVPAGRARAGQFAAGPGLRHPGPAHGRRCRAAPARIDADPGIGFRRG